jgi:hypothetical protein
VAIRNDAASSFASLLKTPMVELNRPQMYMAGIIVLLLGLQFRLTESVVLSEHATKFVAERFDSPELASTTPNWFVQAAPVKKTITPPKWIGWSLISIGGVLVLHSLAMRK